jgi:hypothetical protein
MEKAVLCALPQILAGWLESYAHLFRVYEMETIGPQTIRSLSSSPNVWLKPKILVKYERENLQQRKKTLNLVGNFEFNTSKVWKRRREKESGRGETCLYYRSHRVDHIWNWSPIRLRCSPVKYHRGDPATTRTSSKLCWCGIPLILAKVPRWAVRWRRRRKKEFWYIHIIIKAPKNSMIKFLFSMSPRISRENIQAQTILGCASKESRRKYNR